MKKSPEIESVMRRVVAAWNARDLKTFHNLYITDEFFRGIGTDADEFWVGRDFFSVREAQFDAMPEFEIHLDRIDAFEKGESGWVASTGTLATPTGNHPLRITAVFVIEEGVWRIILWNTSIARSNIELFEIELPTTLSDLLRSVSEDSSAIAMISDSNEIVTLVFTDIVDSTPMTAQIGDFDWVELIGRYEDRIRDIAEQHNGRLVKALGDGSMLAFPSAREAVLASLSIQQAFEGQDFDLRIGVHSGHVVRREDDLLGLTVNKAARVAAAAEGGRVLVSSTTRDLVGSIRGVEFGTPHNVTLKGLEGTHTVLHAYAARESVAGAP